MILDKIDTPQVVIDLDIMDRNLQEMQSYCEQSGFKFRPHIKTHKIPEIAHAQIRAGAIGITCQKIGEAEVMAAAGIRDILLYYNIIGVQKLERLCRLAKRVNISVAADSEIVIRNIGEAAQRSNCEIGVLVDCDTGYHRTGVQTPQHALTLAMLVSEYSNLRFIGLGTFPFTEASSEWFQEAKTVFFEAGLSIPVISGGSSASPAFAHNVGQITELRAGTYIFYDWSAVQTGIASLEQCAARVIATVVSRTTEDLGILDAGSKTLSSDSGYMKSGNGFGYILEYPKAKIYALSEEHGHADFSECETRPEIGEKVSIIPNHICGTINMHDEVLAFRNGELEAVWSIAARGKLR